MKLKHNKTAKQKAKIANTRNRKLTQRLRNLNIAAARNKKVNLRQFENALLEDNINVINVINGAISEPENSIEVKQAKKLFNEMPRNSIIVHIDNKEVDPNVLLGRIRNFERIDILFKGKNEVDDVYLIMMYEPEAPRYSRNKYNANDYDEEEFSIYSAVPYSFFFPGHQGILWKKRLYIVHAFHMFIVYQYLQKHRLPIIKFLNKRRENMKRQKMINRIQKKTKYEQNQFNMPQEVIYNQEKKLGKPFSKNITRKIRTYLNIHPEVQSTLVTSNQNIKSINSSLFE